MSNDFKFKVALRNSKGDEYVATKDDADEPWEICFPEGSTYFYGNRAEVRVLLVRLMKEISSN